MKSYSVRLPEEILEWIRDKAAMETMKRKERVSMNTIVIEILSGVKDAEEERR
jgi:hypothetical protein